MVKSFDKENDKKIENARVASWQRVLPNRTFNNQFLGKPRLAGGK